MRPTTTIRLLAAIGMALLFAGSVVFVLGVGPNAFSAAQAQTTDQQTPVGESGPTGEPTRPLDWNAGEAAQQQDQPRVEGAPGSIQGQGVAMRPGVSSQQEAPPEVKAAPLVLTDEGKAAIEQARRGEGRPSGKDKISPPASAPQPEAPALSTSFLGVEFDPMNPMNQAGSTWIPPDTQIAAGPNNLVIATNGRIRFLSKNGTQRDTNTLDGFFSPLGAAATDVGDPWLAYDPYINRFWILAISRDITTQRSTIFLGLSNTSDATLGWQLWQFDASINGGLGQPGSEDTNLWCDYPKLGFDAQAIYVTCNMLTFDTRAFRYSKVRIMSKSQFVNNTSIRWWDFWNLRQGNAPICLFDLCDKAFTIQPAQMFGASTADGEFLVNAHSQGGNASTLDVWRITNSAECCNGDATGPTLSHNSQAVKSYSAAAGARQPGSTTRINTGDTRLLYAFWKGGNLSTGQTIACGTGGADACLGFTELNLSSFPTISTVNDWAYQSPGVDYYYPAVAVNSAGDKTMVFSRSSSSEFASARYIGIPSSSDCTVCQDGPEQVLHNGGNSYVRLDNFGRNRWGDYSGASPDPNGTGVWVAGEFADTVADEWGVQVGLTYQTALPPANDAFADARIISGSNFSVSGTTRFATREPSEPDHYVTNPPDSDLWVGDHSVWYRWTATFTGKVEVNTCTTNIDSILAVYTGSSLGTLSRVADNNNACSSGSGSKITFNATNGTTYRIAVGDAGGLRENTFTLRLIERKPPTVTSTNPANGAPAVAAGANVLATFSEAMRASTINNTTFNLKKSGTSTILSATVTYDSATRRATLNPSANLQSGTTYVATVTPGAKDLAGNSLDQNPTTAGNQAKTWSFKVG